MTIKSTDLYDYDEVLSLAKKERYSENVIPEGLTTITEIAKRFNVNRAAVKSRVLRQGLIYVKIHQNNAILYNESELVDLMTNAKISNRGGRHLRLQNEQ